jgi:protein arginine kinase activator
MKCQKCGAERATEHVTMIVVGIPTEIHLCEKCSEDNVVVVPARPTAPNCPRCGLGIQEMRAKGRLGCADDYTLFERDVVAFVEKWHGSSTHVGKSPQVLADARRA